MCNCLRFIGKSRDIDLEDLLSSACIKAKLMHELEEDVEPLAQIQVGFALIVDGMAFIHQIHKMSSTFGQLAQWSPTGGPRSGAGP